MLRVRADSGSRAESGNEKPERLRVDDLLFPRSRPARRATRKCTLETGEDGQIRWRHARPHRLLPLAEQGEKAAKCVIVNQLAAISAAL
jgi:hypothetical protein